MSDPSELSAFETAVSRHFKGDMNKLFAIFRRHNDRYIRTEVQEMWIGWCLAKGITP